MEFTEYLYNLKLLAQQERLRIIENAQKPECRKCGSRDFYDTMLDYSCRKCKIENLHNIHYRTIHYMTEIELKENTRKSFKSCAVCEKIKEDIECYQCLTCYAYCCSEKCMFKHNLIHIQEFKGA